MKCTVHPEKDAVSVCVECHKSICTSCEVPIDEKKYCKKCAIAILSISGEIKNISEQATKWAQEKIKKVEHAIQWIKNKKKKNDNIHYHY